MKDYIDGVIYCKCSQKMRGGKHVRVTERTPNKKHCPNCKKMLNIMVTKRTY